MWYILFITRRRFVGGTSAHKMKLFVFGILAFAIAGTVFCDSEESSEEMNKAEVLQNYFHAGVRGFKKGLQKHPEIANNITAEFDHYCPGGSDQIVPKGELLFKCLGELDEDNTFCYDLDHGVPKCFTPLVELFEACLPSESKTLPLHIVNTIKSVFKYICTINGEHIFELANYCVYEKTEKYKNCESKIMEKLHKFKNEVSNREEMCSILTSLRPCFVSHIEEACKHPVTKESYIGIYDALIQPCVGINAVDEEN